NLLTQLMEPLDVSPKAADRIRHSRLSADEERPVAALGQQQLPGCLVQRPLKRPLGAREFVCKLDHAPFRLMLVTIQPLRSFVEPHLLITLLTPRGRHWVRADRVGVFLKNIAKR